MVGIDEEEVAEEKKEKKKKKRESRSDSKKRGEVFCFEVKSRRRCVWRTSGHPNKSKKHRQASKAQTRHKAATLKIGLAFFC